MKDLPKVSTWWLEWGSSPQTSGWKAMNLPLSYHTPHGVELVDCIIFKHWSIWDAKCWNEEMICVSGWSTRENVSGFVVTDLPVNSSLWQALCEEAGVGWSCQCFNGH